jgi:hypothetical protein
VSRLKRVVLPELGGPTTATVRYDALRDSSLGRATAWQLMVEAPMP